MLLIALSVVSAEVIKVYLDEKVRQNICYNDFTYHACHQSSHYLKSMCVARNFESRCPIQDKGHINTFKEDAAFEYCFENSQTEEKV